MPADPKSRRERSELTEFNWSLSPEQMQIVQRGLQSMCQQAGRVIPLGEAVELLFADQLSKHHLDEERLEQAREEAREDLRARDQALLQKCPARDIHWTDTVNALEQSCPLNKAVRLVTREPRVPSPKVRRELLRRDGYQCATPGCPHHLFLQIGDFKAS